MARRVRLAGAAWPLLCAALAALSLWLWWQPAGRWDWQPALAIQQPWRWMTAAGVHWSGMHLAANLLGLLMVALLGARAGCRGQATLAWALAWPATHGALLFQPQLLHYGGLSGVLHAGVAVACCQLLVAPTRPHKRIGVALLLGLLAKVALEAPWLSPLRASQGWDILIAPAAHASGALAGALSGALSGALWLLWPRGRRSAP